MPHTRVWDETNPPGTQAAAQGATRIRDLKVDIQERMLIDHVWDVDVNTDGFHKQVTMLELGADPVAAANYGIVYTKDVAAATHLFFRANDGTVRQITGAISNTTIPWASITGIPAFVSFLDGLVDPNTNSFLIWDDTAGDFAFTPASANPTVYSGFVGSDGSTGNNLPAGWSAVRNSLGKYTLTHNLGVATYAIIAMWDNQATPGRVQVGSSTKAANTVDIHFYNQTDGPAFTDTDWQFHLKRYG
jgi:hypothetical protein